MSPSPRSTAAPALAELTELVHHGTLDHPGSLLVTIEPGSTDVGIGVWPVPPEVDHPADPLVGYLAPPTWSTLGLITSGTMWPDPAGIAPHGPVRGLDPEGEAVRLTVLFGRDGGCATVLGRRSGELEALDEPPQGWVADVLARALGRPAPPPDTSLSYWVERAWLDRLAAELMGRPGSVRRWEDLATVHPLAPPGAALPGVLLAVETRALDLESSWERMRVLWDGPPSTSIIPPGGEELPLHRWFDDGSLSRWVQRNLPEPLDLLPVIIDALPSALADELCEALVAVDVGEL